MQGAPADSRPAGDLVERRQAVADHLQRASGRPLEMRAENVVLHRCEDPEMVVGEFDYVASNPVLGR